MKSIPHMAVYQVQSSTLVHQWEISHLLYAKKSEQLSQMEQSGKEEDTISLSIS